MKINNLFAPATAALALGIAAASCSHDDLELYHGVEAGIYIQEIGHYDLYYNVLDYRNESSPFSFADFGSWMEYTSSFTVRIMGELKDYDRPYIITVDKEKSTAIEGVDFDLSKNDFCIKAGQATDRVQVVLKRNEHCRQNTLEIYLTLQPNEHFIIPFKEYRKNPN